MPHFLKHRSSDLQTRLEELSDELTELTRGESGALANLLLELSRTKIATRELSSLKPMNGVLTQELCSKIVDAVLAGNTVAAALQLNGLKPNHMPKWKAQSEKLLQQMEKDEDFVPDPNEELVLVLVASLAQASAIKENQWVSTIANASLMDWRAAKFLLEKHNPKRWGPSRDKVTVDVKGTVDVKHTGVMVVGHVAQNQADWLESVASQRTLDPAEIPSLPAPKE